ncbi:THO complex subunit 2-like, partial [Saccoglossus kowalevskii]|uniref:THO complex subunit 2-like n=1 Tax=Saccoglossus kowalevskii TaxID=10224 RepID=A0ABM0LW48_SACKO
MAALCVTADSCRNWEKRGKHDFIDLCRRFLHHEPDGIFSADTKDLKRALFELAWHEVEGNLKQEQAVAVLTEVSGLRSDVSSVIADVLNVIDIKTSAIDDKPERAQREKFLSLLTSCM